MSSVLDSFRQQVGLFDMQLPISRRSWRRSATRAGDRRGRAARRALKQPLRLLAVDLGCGTGWAGARLRPHCATPHRLRPLEGILREARRGRLRRARADGRRRVFAPPRRKFGRPHRRDRRPRLHARPRRPDVRGGARAAPAGLFAFSTENATLAETGGLPPPALGGLSGRRSGLLTRPSTSSGR